LVMPSETRFRVYTWVLIAAFLFSILISYDIYW